MNKDKIYYQKNREEILRKAKERYQENPQKVYEKTKKYRKENPEKWAEIKAGCKKKSYARKMKAVRDYKESCACARCGETDPIVLEFHHREPEKKKHGIMQMISSDYSLDRIMEETKKCDVVCANCHKRLHHELKDEDDEN